jgi:hypothetical protein
MPNVTVSSRDGFTKTVGSTARIFPDTLSSEEKILMIIDQIKNLLLEKNRKYGNSALEPMRVFSRSDNLEQIRVRIDDKLSRVKSAQLDEDEEVLNDLIGYLILYRVALI